MKNTKSYIKEIIKKFNKNKVNYILIGRQAVVLYGLPVTSFDYDFWIRPTDREKTFNILLEENFEPSSALKDKKPIVFFIKDIHKIDVFFVNGFGNLLFDECFKRATIFKEKDFSLRVASAEDLIKLKNFRKEKTQKDKEDIKFLKLLKK
ncbi:MAG: hypothetical protein ACK4JE_01790 [Endomicrobiia bacterium]